MTTDEALARLREELEVPFLKIKLEKETYSEEDYQKVKHDIQNYYEEYVRNVEN